MSLPPTIVDNPLFAGLAPVERARLLAELEERRYRAGEVIFRAGDPADGLYLLVEGTVEVRAGEPGAERPIVRLRAPDYFGEQALLTGDPRTTTTVARSDVVVARLPKARFDALLARSPSLALHLGRVLSRRLAAARRAVSAARRELAELVAMRLEELPPDVRDPLRDASVLRRLDADVLDALLGRHDTAELLGRLADEGLVADTDEPGRYVLPPVVAELLHARLERETTPEQRRSLHARAARLLAARGQWAEAAYHYRAAGQPELAAAAQSRARALAQGTLAPHSAEPPPPLAPATAEGAGELARAADRAFRLAASARTLNGALTPARLAGLAAAALVGAAFLLLPAPADLSREAWAALGLLGVFVPLLAFEVVPDYVAGLVLVAAWVLIGAVPARVALGGFATGTWLLVLAVLGLGAAVASSGLLYRAALVALTHLPPTHAAQGIALAALGLLFTPAMPNATARTAMGAPLAAELADALGYTPGSRPRAGLAVAALYGFGQMAGLFLTGSSTGLLVHSVLPPEVRTQITWGTWLGAAWPLHAVILAAGLGTALWWYRPRRQHRLNRDRLALQWRLLGPPTRAERVVGTVFLLVLGGFVTQPLHGIDPAWIGLGGLAVLLSSGALDQETFRRSVNWAFLLYLGVLIGLGDVFAHLGLDTWLAGRLGTPLAALTDSPLAFLEALAVVGFVVSFLVRWQAAAVLLTLVLGPVAQAAGISPWTVGIVALVATNLWLLPYQSTIYLALYYGMGATYTHAAVRPAAWVYAAAVLGGVALSVPYWRALGLLP